jgi:hypothetical protein
MVENDLFDFLLLSLPDNDWYSHKRGVDGQLQSIAQADLQLARVMNAGGGPEQFLDEHAMIVMADHSQAPVRETIALQDALAELGVLGPIRSSEATGEGEPRIAVCPSQRAAMVYALDTSERDAMRASVAALSLAIEGVDLVIWLERDAHERPREGVIASTAHGELRFSPGGELRDQRGASWSVEGELRALSASARDGAFVSAEYPDALARVWSALTCPTSGDVLLSASDGYEFVDWGRQAHVGGGSHGSLHASDSLGALLMCGLEDPEPEPPVWAIRDVAPLIVGHFGSRP